MSHTFLEANISDIVPKLSVEEKISLLGAPNWWNTTPIDRLGIPAIRMSDGPNGVRGSSHFIPANSQCLPCATSLASTFDPELVYEVGVFLAKEAKAKASVILLAPTCNIQRTPLGGRAFESFSEDPYLSGTLAAAYVNGLQSEGVSAIHVAIKHFVGNDQEHERTAADSVMSIRALREIYLYPFMLAQRDAKPGAFMTSFVLLGLANPKQNKNLLTNILRDEWKFEGIIMSDWFGTYGVDQPINAGLDLEMPGPARWRTPQLVLHCLSSQKLLFKTLDERVTNLLTFVQKQAQRNPEIVYGDGIERTRDNPEGRDFCRSLAADGVVLLKNEHNILPINIQEVQKLAVIGPHAKQRVISGGGSAALKATYVVTPLDGIINGAPQELIVEYEVGCYAHKYLPTLENSLVTPSGESGWLCTFYNHNLDGTLSEPIESYILQDTRVKLNDFIPIGLAATWTLRLEGKLEVDTSGPYELGLTVAGRARLWVDGHLTIDNWTRQTPGDFFYGQGTIEEKAVIDATAGIAMDILVEYVNTAAPDGADEHGEGRLAQPALMRGVRLGGCPKIDPDAAIQAAIALARKSDAVLFIGGLSSEWESEGFDRQSLQMPGLQDEVIRRVSQVNRNVIVVLQAGSTVSMPWLNSVASVMQAWYMGNESGNAIADIIYGKVNPGGRLPLSFPSRIEDIPAYLNDRCENGEIHYREDLFVGYKHYQAKKIEPLFPFGFGLSYTTFSLSHLCVDEIPDDEKFRLRIEVSLTNTGRVSGSEVIQIYVSYPDAGLTTPRFQLKGFKKVKNLAPGMTKTAVMILDKYAVSLWDVKRNAWFAAVGKYSFYVGTSSANLPLCTSYNLRRGFSWKAL